MCASLLTLFDKPKEIYGIVLIKYVYKYVTSTKNTCAYKNKKIHIKNLVLKNAKIHHYVVYIDVCKV
jgi:hypothetical protein